MMARMMLNTRCGLVSSRGSNFARDRLKTLAGPLGVAHVIRLLHDELEATMALCGVARLEQISTAYLYDNPTRRTEP